MLPRGDFFEVFPSGHAGNEATRLPRSNFRFCSEIGFRGGGAFQNMRGRARKQVAKSATVPLEPHGTVSPLVPNPWNPWNPWNLWNRIDGSHRRPGSAPKDSLRREISTLSEAIPLDGFLAVMTTSNCEPALHAKPGVNRRERCLIEVDAADCGRRGPLRRWRTAKIQRDRDEQDHRDRTKAKLRTYPQSLTGPE